MKGLCYEDVEIGDDIGPVSRVVTNDQVRQFVGIWRSEESASRFTDDEVAKREGLPGPIVPGPMNVALVAQLITGWTPSVRVKKLDVVFRQLVRHDVPIQIAGVVTDKNIVDGEPRLECDVYMEGENGTRLVIGKATVTLPARGS